MLLKRATLEAIREQLNFSEIQARITHDEPLLTRLFEQWWVEPFSLSAWKEASGEPITQGAE